MYIGNHDYMMRSLGYSLREADGDPNTEVPAEDNGAETADAGADPNTGDTSGEEKTTDDTGDSTEESPDDSSEEEASDEGEETDDADADFDIDAEDDTGEEEAGEGDSSDDPNTDDSSEEDSEEEVDPDSVKALDGKLYEDLSPAEQKLKTRQLKQLFTELFYSCASIAEKLNSIYIEDKEAHLQVKMAGSMVFNLKQMISDYFLNTFNSKSFLENDIMFNRYLGVLDQVKGLVEEVKKIYFADTE